MGYNFTDIEKKWQARWKENNTYRVKEDESKEKFYVLNMFPYPSGAGLHVGHPLGYIASDIYARYKRLQGYNVLNPMGYDAYGLPAEQYAIQTGQHPAITTDVIVGFPGETQEEFETTRAFLEKVSFYEMHIFKYSKRKGTRAAVMENQIPEPEKTKRSNVLLEMEAKDSAAFREYYLDQDVEVLFEEKKEINGKEYWIGHTKEYVKVALADGGEYANCLIEGKVIGALNKEVLLMEKNALNFQTN